MLKLDKTYSTSRNLFEMKDEVIPYLGMRKEEIAKVFAYLNSVSFNYTLAHPPKWTNQFFQCAKISHGEYLSKI